MDDIDRLIARHQADLAIPAFDAVLARRARRRVPTAPLVVAAAIVLVLAGLSVSPLRERLAAPRPGAATLTPLVLPAGLVLASPAGDRIAVVGAAAVTLHDAGGRELQRFAAATTYAKWLPDGSGLLVQTRASAPGTASLVVLEADGRTTALDLAVPPASASYTWLSPDGRSFAADTATAVVTLARDGSAPRTVIAGADHRLVGFDADGRVLVIDGPDARALGSGGYTVALPTLGNPLYESGTGTSPDGTVTLVSMATPVDQLIAISGREARAIPRPYGWVGPHSFIARRSGAAGIELWDAATGQHDLLSAIPNNATLHGTSGGRVLWTLSGITHVTDVATSADRIVATLPVSAKAQPLGDGRFLVIDGEDREVLAPE